jgi:glycosyl transferase family 2
MLVLVVVVSLLRTAAGTCGTGRAAGPRRPAERHRAGSSPGERVAVAAVVRPRFSVVVPAYNESAYLPRTLTSLRRQDFPGPVEVIVVDNNSDDDTAAVARRHGVRVLHEAQPGVCAARQRGSEAATGEILVSTDADTVHPEDWLRRIDATFASKKGVVAVAGPCRYDGARGWTDRYPRLLFGLVGWFFARTRYVGYVSATNLAIRRSAFPGYDQRLTQGGDELDLLRRLRPQGAVVWDARNVVTTSPRRLTQGFLHTFFITFLGYYLGAYLVNRLSGRPRVGTAPPVREPRPVGSPDRDTSVPTRTARTLRPLRPWRPARPTGGDDGGGRRVLPGSTEHTQGERETSSR